MLKNVLSNILPIGTRSVLFGAHCFLIHPWFVFAAWWKLYGFPFDLRLWVAFFVHDLGYWGKPNMDGEEGETHVEFGAKVMHKLFDKWFINISGHKYQTKIWYNFCIYHSRFYAKKDNVKPSKLCMADKLAVALEPYWLYLPRVIWTGEIKEYMKDAAVGKYVTMKLSLSSQKEWFLSVCKYLKAYAYEHKDGKDDRWTPTIKQAINKHGVWQ
jgi:hypothetical protein